MTTAPSFPALDLGGLERYRVPASGWAKRLADMDPRDRSGIPFPKPEVEAATAADIAEIDRLQDVLYPQGRQALLTIFQGPDTSGKDGTTRRVFGGVNPLGILAVSFKEPTPIELTHDYLWRVHKVVPAAGMIGLFNRSHYEDVLVARVHRLTPPERIEARYDQINGFERHLAENDVTIVKFYLHISKEERRSGFGLGRKIPPSGGKSNPAISPSASTGTTTRRPTRSRSNGAAPNGRPGSSFPRTGNGTGTQSLRALSAARSKPWI